MSDLREPARLNEVIGADRARITGMREVSRLRDVEFEALRVVHPLTRNEQTRERFDTLVKMLVELYAKPNFVVGVTGITSGVGASYVALNTAVALAGDFRRTALLVQCSAQRTPLARMLLPPPELGLSDYLLQKELQADDIVYAPGVARMRVIPFGNEASAVPLLAHERMRGLLDTMRARYSDRFIVLDLPEVDAIAELGPLLDWLDGTVLVVPHGGAGRAGVQRAVDLIGSERLAGLVMNRVPLS